MNHRLYKTLLLTFVLAAAFCVLYALYDYTGIGIPCPINALTGLLCPACGTFRMLSAAARLEFALAASYNPVMFALLPLLLLLFASYAIRYIKSGTKSFTRGQNALAVLVIAALVVFGVLRNIV